MVGPGEADDDLESETAEECAKYGRVEKCVIHELQGVVDDEAVRIFVKFANAQGAVSGNLMPLPPLEEILFPYLVC